MQWAELYQKETEKPLVRFITDLKSTGELRGFITYNSYVAINAMIDVVL